MIKDNQNTLNRLHIVIDAVLIIAAFYLTYPLRFYILPNIFKIFVIKPGERFLTFEQYSLNVVFLVPGYLLIYNMLGLYRPRRTHSMIKTVGSLFNANILGIFYFAFLIYARKQNDVSRLFYATFGAVNFVLGAAFRIILILILRQIRKAGRNLKHILIVGYSRTTEGFIDRVRANPDWGYKLFGILADSMAVGTRYKGVEVMAPILELDEYIENNSFDEIVITLGIDKYDRLERIVDICEKSGVHTKFIPDYGNMISTVPYIEDLYGLPVINIRNVPLTNTANIVFKRLFDIIVGSIALVIFAIPMLVIALIIKITSPGPIIFSQIRVGKHGREFKMYKFRSMRVEDPEKEKEEWTTRKDSRVTPIGRFIRKTSLDETPQLFNVLAGSMSLVGPRPERPQFVEKFKEEIPRYMIKHQVRPGMTGWAQINGYRGDTSIKKRIEHDLYYIENWTMWLDIKILILTVFKGFINKNAY